VSTLSLFYLKFAVHLLSFLFHVIWWTLYQEIIEYSLCLVIIVAVGFLIYFFTTHLVQNISLNI
jgi:hypothetical protein